MEEGEEVVLGGKGSRVVSPLLSKALPRKGKVSGAYKIYNQNTTTPVFNILGLRLKPFMTYMYNQQ